MVDYVVLAELRVEPARIREFCAFMRRHAELSRQEPGCRSFEVCQDRADAAHFLFYEAFDDEAAYAAHRVTPHYQRWRETGSRMVVPQENGGLFLRRRVLTRLSP